MKRQFIVNPDMLGPDQQKLWNDIQHIDKRKFQEYFKPGEPLTFPKRRTA